MTISANGTGTVLYFSYEELYDHPSFSGTFTQENVLSLIRSVLVSSDRPIPPTMEVKYFPSHHGILLFILPSLPASPPSRPFSARNFS